MVGGGAAVLLLLVVAVVGGLVVRVGGPGPGLGAQGPRGGEVVLVAARDHLEHRPVEELLVQLLLGFHAVDSNVMQILVVCNRLLCPQNFPSHLS